MTRLSSHNPSASNSPLGAVPKLEFSRGQNSRRARIYLFGAKVLASVAVLCFAVSCNKPNQHSVDISWQPSAQVDGVHVVGYNLYRSTTPGGPYVVIASRVAGTTYRDTLVNSGTTYYYVVTTVDSTGRESRRSDEINAVVP